MASPQPIRSFAAQGGNTFSSVVSQLRDSIYFSTHSPSPLFLAVLIVLIVLGILNILTGAGVLVAQSLNGNKLELKQLWVFRWLPHSSFIQPNILVMTGLQAILTTIGSDWALGQDPGVWGPDCNSRLIDEQGELRRETQWKFHAFNGGPRLWCIPSGFSHMALVHARISGPTQIDAPCNCSLGQTLATFEAICVIVDLVRNFDLDFAPGWYESVPKTGDIAPGCIEEGMPLYRPSLTLPMKYPLQVVVRMRTWEEDVGRHLPDLSSP